VAFTLPADERKEKEEKETAYPPKKYKKCPQKAVVTFFPRKEEKKKGEEPTRPLKPLFHLKKNEVFELYHKRKRTKKITGKGKGGKKKKYLPWVWRNREKSWTVSCSLALGREGKKKPPVS